MKDSQADSDRIRLKWFDHLMPVVEPAKVKDVFSLVFSLFCRDLRARGKRRWRRTSCERVRRKRDSIDFYANTTYEAFVGGLARVQTEGALGLQFAPMAGFLMNGAAAAMKDPRPYLLHIDEINRADLSKILGEAIFLVGPEHEQGTNR